MELSWGSAEAPPPSLPLSLFSVKLFVYRSVLKVKTNTRSLIGWGWGRGGWGGVSGEPWKRLQTTRCINFFIFYINVRTQDDTDEFTWNRQTFLSLTLTDGEWRTDNNKKQQQQVNSFSYKQFNCTTIYMNCSAVWSLTGNKTFNPLKPKCTAALAQKRKKKNRGRKRKKRKAPHLSVIFLTCCSWSQLEMNEL